MRFFFFNVFSRMQDWWFTVFRVMSSKLKQGNHINRKPEKRMGQRPLRNVWEKFYYDKMCSSGTRYENRL